MSDPAIEIRDASCGYLGREVLHGVGMAVRPGEFVGVIGPNGAGKSTLIRLLARAIPLRSGGLRLFGREADTYGRKEWARLVAMVPQETAIPFPFRAREMVLMGRTPHLSGFALEGPADREAARRAMEWTGTEPLADRPVGELSGGERQRVVLARALAQATPVLLLDEPGAFLDLRNSLAIFDLLRRLAREEGKAVVCVSHDLNLPAARWDRVLLLAAGRVVAFGPPAEVLTAERLSEAYGVEVAVIESGGLRAYLPVKERKN